ncbi:PREDICTED: stAR-related lipid transfer protein 7, mitochondrial [Sturnus vulgaris]|uniref:stAR-related lipid transfer protein 7, mitochondrial n=1 Tax=Sturnus vulgaris TaxID=9172 RepID=UPI00071A52F3|nr:PREDICTED: stAR-related lipid transfer protein 7, mitochondrial [Sturnus vulgaris]
MWRPLAALAARGASGARGGASTSPGACSAAGPPAGHRPLLLLLSLLARHGGCGRALRASGHRDFATGTGRVDVNVAVLFLARSAQELQQLESPGQAREQERPWELMMERPHFRLWRRPIPGSPLYQYRVFGSYTDVTPRQFFNVQVSRIPRNSWKFLGNSWNFWPLLELGWESGSGIWVTRFPYPMYSRDYVYVRRYSVDSDHNLMVLVSRAVEHPGIPEDPEHVRVRSYESHMVIRPHRGFDENGFDYLLTYSDNPQTVFPRYCLSWMVSSGMPEFLDKLHSAALKAKKMELELRDYLSPAKGPEPCGAARLEYA